MMSQRELHLSVALNTCLHITATKDLNSTGGIVIEASYITVHS